MCGVRGSVWCERGSVRACVHVWCVHVWCVCGMREGVYVCVWCGGSVRVCGVRGSVLVCVCVCVWCERGSVHMYLSEDSFQGLNPGR